MQPPMQEKKVSPQRQQGTGGGEDLQIDNLFMLQ